MTALTELFSGGSDADEAGPAEAGAARERAEQLRRGTEAAAASLPDRHAALARRAVDTARAVEAAVEGPEPAAGSLIQGLQRLHFRLVRLGVQPEETTAAEVEEAVEALADAAAGTGAA